VLGGFKELKGGYALGLKEGFWGGCASRKSNKKRRRVKEGGGCEGPDCPIRSEFRL